MGLWTISKTTFWGEGSKELLRLVRDRNRGRLFDRIFGYESESADINEKCDRLLKYCADNIRNFDYKVDYNDDGSFSLGMRTFPFFPFGVFEKISSLYPEIHADGLFIEEDYYYLGGCLIENGEFNLTIIQNPKGRIYGKLPNFRKFFTYDYNEMTDLTYRNLMLLLKTEKALLRGESSAKAEMEKLLTVFPDEDDESPKEGFFLSKLEKQSFLGNPEAQSKLGSWMIEEPDDFIMHNPNINYYSRKYNTEECCIDEGIYWRKKAALQGNRDCISSLLKYYKRKAFDDRQIDKWEKLAKTAESVG